MNTPPIDQTAPAQLLERAASIIERSGWQQGRYWPGPEPADGPPIGHYITGDPCCTLGALAVSAGVYLAAEVDDALTDLPALAEAIEALEQEIRRRDPDHCAVWLWNDHRDRTAAHVVATLREAAQRLTPTAVDARCGGPSATVSHPTGPVSSTREQITRQELVNP